jgi:serine/threonine-protein kinase HipA
MTIRTLNASANGRRVGTITDENGVWSFTYDANWLSADNAFPLSPALPLSAERVIDGSTLRPVQWLFDNLLPEEGMRTALAREAKVDASDAWGLLAHFGRESAGALTLLPDGEHESAGGRVPLSLDQLEARIQAMPQHALTATSPKRMSAAGAQQKLLLVLEGHHPEYLLFEPEGTEPSMHLLKHARHGLPALRHQRVFLHAARQRDGVAGAGHALHQGTLGLLCGGPFRPRHLKLSRYPATHHRRDAIAQYG